MARKRVVRGRTVPIKKMTKEQLQLGQMLYPSLRENRPMTRGECCEVQRPCPYVGCKYNLYLDVNRKTGSIKLNFPDIDPWELSESCVLDVAQSMGVTLEEVGEVMNLTRERIRQLEVMALERLIFLLEEDDDFREAVLP